LINPRPWMRAVVTLTAAFAFPSFAVAQTIDASKVLTAADLEAAVGQKVTVAGTDASGTGPGPGDRRRLAEGSAGAVVEAARRQGLEQIVGARRRGRGSSRIFTNQPRAGP